MNQYEIAILYDPDLEIDLEKATSRVEKIFTDNAAKITKVDNWGKRKLAYTIKGHESGIYVFYTLDIAPENVRKIETILNITDEIVRFLIVRPDLRAIAKAEAARADKARRAMERGEDSSAEDAPEETDAKDEA
jgi:small subunit ribosomal protein S6